MTGLSLALGLQPLPQGEEKVPDSDVYAPNVHLAVLQDLPPRQTKLTDAFTDFLEHLAFTVCNQAVKGKPGYKVWIQNIFQNQTGWIPAAGGPCRGAGLRGITHQGKNGLCTCQVVGHLVHPEATVELNLPKLSPPGLRDKVGGVLCQRIKRTGGAVRTEVTTRVDACLQHIRYLVKHELVGVRSDGQVLHDHTLQLLSLL